MMKLQNYGLSGVMGIMIGLLSAQAQDAVEANAVPDETVWKAERKKLEEQIESKVQSAVQNLVNPQQVAAKKRFAWPVKEPAKSPAEIQKIIDQQVAGEVEQKFPMKQLPEIIKEVEEKYKAFKDNDDISFELRGGHGANTKVRGRLIDVSADRIKLDTRWIATRDIDEETLARFYPEAAKQLIDKKTQAEKRRYMIKRENYAEGRTDEMLQNMMPANGYMHSREDKRDKKWYPVKTIFERELEKEKKEAAESERKKIEPEVYQAGNFVLYEGEWIPVAVADAKKAAIEEAARQETTEQPAEYGAPAGGIMPMPFGIPPPYPPAGGQQPQGGSAPVGPMPGGAAILPPGVQLPPGGQMPAGMPPNVPLPPGTFLPGGVKVPPAASSTPAPSGEVPSFFK